MDESATESVHTHNIVTSDQERSNSTSPQEGDMAPEYDESILQNKRTTRVMVDYDSLRRNQPAKRPNNNGKTHLWGKKLCLGLNPGIGAWISNRDLGCDHVLRVIQEDVFIVCVGIVVVTVTANVSLAQSKLRATPPRRFVQGGRIEPETNK